MGCTCSRPRLTGRRAAVAVVSGPRAAATDPALSRRYLPPRSLGEALPSPLRSLHSQGPSCRQVELQPHEFVGQAVRDFPWGLGVPVSRAWVLGSQCRAAADNVCVRDSGRPRGARAGLGSGGAHGASEASSPLLQNAARGHVCARCVRLLPAPRSQTPHSSPPPSRAKGRPACLEQRERQQLQLPVTSCPRGRMAGVLQAKSSLASPSRGAATTVPPPHCCRRRRETPGALGAGPRLLAQSAKIPSVNSFRFPSPEVPEVPRLGQRHRMMSSPMFHASLWDSMAG